MLGGVCPHLASIQHKTHVRRVSVPSATAGFACIANVPPTGAWHLASLLGDASIQNPPADRRVSVPGATESPQRVPGT